MKYLIALLCPPLAILLCGRLFLALISIPLLLFYFPSALLALLVVSSSNADRRHREHLSAMKDQTREMTKAMKKQRHEPRVTVVQQTVNVIVPQVPQQKLAPPAPSAVEVEDVPELPRQPIFAVIKGNVSIAIKSGVEAYKDLPEWAQPISWGLAAGSALSIPFVGFMIFRR